MAEYVPELLNELTRIVITTRNANPSVVAYDEIVLPEWRACEQLRVRIEQEQDNVPTLDQMRAVYRGVLHMLTVKLVPADEIARRFDEAFTRCHSGPYPVDRAAVEAGIREEVDAALAARLTVASAG